MEFASLGKRFRETARNISEARCDVLYYWEIGSDALNYFLPFASPAPVQCLSWGTPGTSGNPLVQFYLSSDLVETENGGEHYAEELWRLNSLPTWQKRIAAAPKSNRSLFGFNDNDHLYLCPQVLLKYQPENDALWGQILRADRQGRLILMQSQHPKSSALLRERLQRNLPDVFERVVLMPFQSRDNFYRLLVSADAILDVPGFSAGSSAYDVFSLNRGIVTLPGATFISRYTLGCYRKMDYSELVVDSTDAYVDKAVRLASDRAYRDGVIKTLTERSNLLFEDKATLSGHEEFFRRATERARSA